uniref:Cedrol synthase n=1 Tax=Leucosceptrum canum TaxID=694369 RepID=A0A482IC14_LEUCN|nr:cedrol synthase [Leucosceptrum canum]
MITASVVDGTLSCLRDVRPPVTIHPPCIWGDKLSTFSMDDQVQNKYAEGIEALKDEARSKLMGATSTKLMILVDSLERLGLAYHFETQIEEKLQEMYKEDDGGDHDLLATSLRFRLLRQHRYHVSCSVFDKFKDSDDKFKEALISDVEGLLSLYEAAYVQISGEGILQEALEFTTHHLTRVAPQLECPLKDKVNRALEHPLHRDVPIFHALIFIPIYATDESRDELLQRLATLNFNFLQNLYKKELCELSRWWNKFDLKSKLPYIRDSLVGSYLWAAAFHFEPQYSGVRMAVTKCLQIAVVMDDTYDNYATLGEAQLFTETLERWSMDEIDGLPDYMKTVYHFIMSTYEDYERDTTKEQMFAIPYFKEAVKQLGRAYNQELKWVMERQMPSFEEYVKNSEITSCVYVLFTALFPFLKSATKETIDWLLSEPQLAISTAMIGRFCDDLGSHERESKGGEMLTVLDCYMKQHGVSKQETVSKFAEIIEDAWKDLNAAWATTTSSPKEMVEQFLNYARMAGATYKNNGDAYTNPKYVFGPYIDALFVNPLVI